VPRREPRMETIGLSETIGALRAELAAAAAMARDADIQFPVGGVQLEFHFGVTKTGEGKAGVKFWVVELGGGGSYASESIQTVTVTLDPPVDRTGQPVKVSRDYDQRP
jgi:Trypsin-co-occurring domain 2